MSMRSIGLQALVCVAVAGCSYGNVTDKTTGELLGGTYVMVHQVTTNVASSSGGPIEKTGLQTSYTWASGNGKGYWYLNPYGTKNSGDNTTTFIPVGWDRFYALQSGYDARVFFRNHQYTDCSVYGDKNPYSNGPYPYDTSVPLVSGKSCGAESFQLHKSTEDYAKDPDIIVDPRTILDNTYTTVRGSVGQPWNGVGATCEGRSDTCIRVSVGTPNVGVGDLWLNAPANVASPPVTQRRFNRISGTTTNTAIPGTFVSDGHPHLHFTNWTQIRLRKIDTTCNTEATAAKCAIQPQTGAKQSFCLTETNTFDTSTVAQVYMPNKTYSCTVDSTGAFTGTANTITQGIGSGKMDVYTKGLSGQMIPTDGLHGDFWLEVEVNPADATGKRAVIESDYSNNVSRVKVSIP